MSENPPYDPPKIEDQRERRESKRLPGFIEEVDADPAPEIQPGPTHPHVEFLVHRAAGYSVDGKWAERSKDLSPAMAAELAYHQAIFDLREHTSEPTVESGVVLPTGEHVPKKDD